jgi:2-keto-4-pentenoate hydratase
VRRRRRKQRRSACPRRRNESRTPDDLFDTVTAIDPTTLAREMIAAQTGRQPIAAPPSARDPEFDVTAAYAVEAEIARIRRASGHATVGRKVGFANKAMWRLLKLDTLVWAHMYDDTVLYSTHGIAALRVGRMYAPKIEPEIVFKLHTPVAAGETDPAAVLGAVEWIAIGFEIIDCVFPDWKFQPADFVAAYGLHAALVIGEPRTIEAATIPTLVEQLAQFKIRLFKNGEQVDEGSGKNSLRSPALCVAELAAAVTRQPDAMPLAAGELISSGTLTTSQPIAAGETWRADVEGIELQSLLLRTSS